MLALQEVIEFCAAEQGRRHVLSVPVPLVWLMGSAEGGLFVAQLLAWSGKQDDWLALSAAEWTAATGLPASRVRALSRRGQALGILAVRALPPGAEAAHAYRLLRAPLLRALATHLRAEQPRRTRRRRAARRLARLPLQAEPEQWRAAPARSPARQPAASPLLAAATTLPPLRPVTANGLGRQAAGNGARPTPIVLAPAPRNGTSPARNGAQPAHNVYGTKGSGTRPQSGAPFDAARWQAALGEMARRVPPDAFARWLARSRFAAVEGGQVVVVTVDDMNQAWWVNTRLLPVVERAVNLVARGPGWLQVEARPC